MASPGRTWDASSKMTTSKCMSGGRYWLTDSGLIMKHGLIAWVTGAVFASRFATGMCRRLLLRLAAR